MNTSKWRRKLFATTTVVISILILAALVISANAGTSNKVSISVPVSDIGKAKIQHVSGNQSLINIGSFPQGGNPGDPMLPYKSITLLVPPNADLGKVTAGLVSESWEELPGEYEIAAVKPAAASNGESVTVSWGGKDPSHIVNGQDSDIYSSDAYFPSKTVEVISVGKFRQWKLVELRVWLASYNPVQKKVRVLKDTETVLSIDKLAADKAVGLDSAVLPAIPKTEKFEPELRSKIANPQDISTFYGPQPGAAAASSGGPAPSAPGTVPANYVIITTNKIVTNSTKLANFITAKTTAGFTVKTVTEGAIPGDFTYVSGATCDSRANNIRAWLSLYYLGDGIQYVLLIGNPNPTTFDVNLSVPMKMCWPRNGQAGPAKEIQAPSDMYFAELSGNWDLDGDLKFGEFNGDYGFGGADKNCELKVGRIPVYNSNCVDLDAILQKCIDYNTATGDKSWRAKVLVPAAISNFGPQDNNGDGDATDPGDFQWASDQTFGDDWGEDIKSLATSSMVNPYTLYEKTGIYGNGSAYPLTACNAPLNNANVINEWKNKYGFVTWWGHGDSTSASQFTWTSDSIFQFITGNLLPHLETTFTNFVQTADCTQLDNNSPSFVVEVSCENGWPEVATNLAFSLLKQGAIGTISGTRDTWYSIGSWNTWIAANTGDNASYGYYCFDRMANSGEDIGTALVYCRSNFGTNWADGASWMNMVGFNIYGDPALKLNLTGPKWKQEPDTSENGIDIRCDRTDGIPRLLADDFLCTQTGPINKVTLWGSWFYDQYGLKGVIKSIHLSIHSDKPAGIKPFSEPNELLWSKTFSMADISESLFKDELYEHWWDPYMMTSTVWPGDTQIWKYDINIPSGGFIQQGDPCYPMIYWLDVNVEIDPVLSPPGAMFGWKTAKNHWNDDAVRWDDIAQQWIEMRYPPGHPDCPNSIDLAFAIHTGPQEEPKEPMKHLKWSQPPIETDSSAHNITFCGWDEKSFNKDEYNPQGPFKMVCDDFRCLGTMPITSIHWWGSYFNWEQGAGLPPVVPTGWWVGFWSNQPQGQFPYSYPNVLLHSFTVDANRVEIEKVGTDEYYGYYPYDICYQYTLRLNPEEVFRQMDFNEQTQDNVYWLSIVAFYPIMPEPVYNPWGWKTRPWHWMDDAVTVNLPVIPAQGYTIDPLIDPVTPLVDPMWQKSMDVSFELDTDPNYIKWEQDFNGIRTWPHYEDVNSTMNMMDPLNERLVADDWRCLRRTPVTAIVWWGSYIGYQYEACGTTFWPLPVPPNRFKLTIWTDVPADPCNPLSYSHPGNAIWQYVTENFDEVLVGYDKHPEQTQPIQTEPVFRYSVRLPEAHWFRQPDYNEVFWLSVQAVYDTIQPNYLWGWTNHQHVFNDDAVQGYTNQTGGIWQWDELSDQTGASEDMSFVLFTDPNECSTCANYNCDTLVDFVDYADFADGWLAVVPPGGFDNSDLDCNGTIDLLDLAIFTQQWLTSCP